MRIVASFIYLIFWAIVFALLKEIWPRANVVSLFLVTGLLSFVATFFHELGHAVAAWKIGGRVKTFCVMPFAIRTGPLRLTVAHREKLGGDVGGYVSPVFERRLSSRETIVLSAAGPAANAVLTLLCVAMLLLIGGCEPSAQVVMAGQVDAPTTLLPPDSALESAARRAAGMRLWSVIEGLVEALAVLSAGMAVVNLIPFRRSDGAMIVEALSKR